MRRIAAPMVGGMVSATVLTLVVIPVVFYWVRGRQLDKAADNGSLNSQAAEASDENRN
jgi:hypothetical protein